MNNGNKTIFQRIKEKISVTYLLYAFLLGAIVIFSLFPVFIDLEHADWKKVIGKFLISSCIVVAIFFLRLIDKQRLAKENDKSVYNETKNDFVKTTKDIINLSASHYHSLYIEEKNEELRFNYIKQVFHSHDIEMELYDCPSVVVDQLYKDNKITKDKYTIITKMRRGQFEVDTYKIKDLTCQELLTKTRDTNKNQTSSIILSEIFSKLIMMLVITFLLSALIPDNTSSTGQAQRWIELASRLFSFIGGWICGDTCGDKVVLENIRLYKKFFTFNSTFLQEFTHKIWIPKEEIPKEITKKMDEENQEEKEEEENPIPTREIFMTRKEYEEMQKLKGSQ